MRPISGSGPLPWWNEQITGAALMAAEAAYPNETGGLFWAHGHSGRPELHVFAGGFTPSSFEVDPQAVISFVYDILDKQRGVVLATFHSHPMGQRSFSTQDACLLPDWAGRHVLAVKEPLGWQVIFGQS